MTPTAKPIIGQCIALTLIAIFCVHNAFLQFPLKKTVSISEGGAACVEVPGHQWFTLDATEYSVVGQFFSTSYSTRFGRFTTRYYNIMVPGNGTNPDFVMAVRVTDNKARSLAQGKTVALYGRISPLNQSLSALQQEMSDRPSAKLVANCLKDTGNTLGSNIRDCILGTIFGWLAWLSWKDYFRHAKARRSAANLRKNLS